MANRLTTLSENTASARPRGLLAEWGLSVLVETEDQNVVLDAGASISAARNGFLLGVDWQRIDTVVLSHGHYDHTGGLREVMSRINKRVKVVAHPDVFDAKYIQMSQDETPVYIGIPFQRAELESLGADFHLTAEPVWLTDSVVTSGEIPMVTDYETIDPGLCTRRNGELVPDPVADDQALFIKTDKGLAVVLGCAHHGIINTLRHAQEVTGMKQVHTVIGGTHLIRASEMQMEMTIAELKEIGVERLGVSHCTGMGAAVRLAEEFGQKFFFNNTGISVAL